MTTTTETDRIERSIVINAPREKVWSALADAQKFGAWFGANLEGQAFAPGQRTRGQITICGHEDAVFDVVVVDMAAPEKMSFHWHPYAVDPKIDYASEEPTLVTFMLAEAGAGTLLKVIESGFDKVPPQRRLEAFRMNDRGWEAQLNCIARYVSA